ncbi:MAG TPA: glycoside hydrolase family 6 protein [Nocardioides sp.]|uniref:glycoside hydrolase family 6 protein n=1 Tax=Nocardioides sp. TaxID=35761 RepID=UPI002E2EE874|nr:glycoside hydrolase family 6 protein [Nocardioides sp.]HEX3930300.1 glycoside hydrolase family 6 protein [Nocardioides sp.]
MPSALLGLLSALLLPLGFGPGVTTGTTAGTALPHEARAASGNPLAGHPWGTYEGPQELSWAPYQNATGHRKKLLGYIALAPKAKWFGAWIPDDQIADRVSEYIANAQHGDPSTLVQLTVFRMVPWEQEACQRLPTKAERTSYKRWVNRFAKAVGSARAAVVVQPDGPFALCAPHGSKAPSHLVSYAAKRIARQPNASVYVEAGAADWPAAGQGGVRAAARLLVRGGVRYARGFALDSTHFDSTTAEVRRAAAISRRLATLGYAGRTAVINTSSNGHPYVYGDYTGKDPDNPMVCASATVPATTTCATLGIPPTTRVGAARWGLSAHVSRLARKYVDAYLWVGRPWLYRQSQPFVAKRALRLVRSTPWR